MKKRIFVIGAILAAAVGLAACESVRSSEGKYEALNEMLEADYTKIVLTVTDTFAENLFLESEYTINVSDEGTTIAYEVEQFAELSLDGSNSAIKTKLRGEALIVDGEIADGEDIGIDADIVHARFDFKEQYFENAELTSISFKADVKDAGGFFGSKITCTDMRVEATFLSAFYNINISYTSEVGSKVEYTYVFTF